MESLKCEISFRYLIQYLFLFAIYANIDQFQYDASKALPLSLRSELDQWIVSRLQSVISQYRMYMDDFEPTQAARVIESFVSDDLSNWFVRLSRRRYWKSESSSDKQAAFETLYECLYNSSILIASLAPFSLTGFIRI